MPNGSVATYTLRFNADTNQAKRELQSLQNAITNVVTQRYDSDPLKNFTKEANEAAGEIAKLSTELQKSSNNNGTLNIAKLANLWKENGKSLDYYREHFKRLGPEGEEAFNRLAASIANAQQPIKELDGLIGKFAKGLVNTAMWTIQSNAIHAFQSALSGAFSYAQKLNQGLTDIAIVADMSSDKLAQFAKDANKYAQQWSTTTNEYVKGALIYYQQGLSGEEVIEKTNTTVKLANTSGESAEQISSYMTAIWNNFDDGSKSVEYYADVISYLGAATAASNADIAEGMEAFAATANTVGLSYEYAASALTTLRHVTQQSASTIGNSLKTIFARLSSLKTGETTEDGVDLTKYTAELAKYGVNVKDANGELKDMDEILDDLSVKWEKLSRSQKVALAQTVGGVRQYNNLISLMDNYTYFQELVQGSRESNGYLNKQSEVFEESWQAATNHVQTAIEKLYDILINDKFIISLTNGLAKIIDLVGTIIEKAGGLRTLLPLIISYMTTGMQDRLSAAVDRIKELVNQTFKWKEMMKEANLMRADAIASTINSNIPEFDNSRAAGKKTFDALKNRLIDEFTNLRGLISEGAPQDVITQVSLMLEKEANALNGFVRKQNDIDAAVNELKMISPDIANYIEALYKIGDLQDFVLSDDFNKNSDEDIITMLTSKNFSSNAMNFFGEGYEEFSKAFEDLNIKEHTFKGETFKNKEELQKLLIKHIEAYYDKLDAQLDAILKENLKDKVSNDNKEQKTSKTVTKDTKNKKDNAEATNQAALAEENLANAVKDYGDQARMTAIEASNLNKKGEEAQILMQKQSEELQKLALQRAEERASMANQLNAIIGVASAYGAMASAAFSAVDGLWEMITAFQSGENASQNFVEGLKKVGASLGSMLTSFSQYTRTVESLVTISPQFAGFFDKLSSNVIGLGKAIIGAIPGLGGLILGETAATGTTLTLTGAITGLWEALSPALPVIGGLLLLAGAIKAIGVGIQWLISLTPSGKLKKLHEETEKAAQTANESAEAYNNLITTLSNIDDKENALSKMSRNTKEWKDAVEELNKEMLLLIAEENLVFGKDNDWWYDADGKIIFAEGVKEKISERRAEKAREDKNTELTSKVRENRQAYDNNNSYVKSNQFAVGNLVEEINDDAINKVYSNIDWYNKDSVQGLLNIIKDYQNRQKNAYEEINGEGSWEPTGDAGGILSEFTLDDLFNEDYINYENSLIQLLKNNIDDDISNGALRLIAKEIANGTLVFDENDIKNSWEKNKEKINEIIEKNPIASAWTQEELDARQLAEDTAYAKSLGFDPDEYQKYVSYLQEVSKKLKENQIAADQVAIANMRINRGVETLSKNINDWTEEIKLATDAEFDWQKDGYKYMEAMEGIRGALSDIANVDLHDLDFDFIEDHLKDIEKAATGDEKAVDKLIKLIAVDFVDALDGLKDENTFSNLQQQMVDLINSTDFGSIEIGTTLNTGPFNELLTTMVANSEIAADDINGFLARIGYTPIVDYEEIPIDDTHVTTDEANGTYTVRDDEGNEYTLNSSAVVSNTAGEKGMLRIPIIKGSNDGGGFKLATSDTMTQAFSSSVFTGGTGRNITGGNRQGGSKGGGGGSERKKKPKDEDRYHEINQKLKQTEHELDKVNTLKDRAYGKGRLDAMDQEIKLLEREAEQYKEMYAEAQHWYELDKSALLGYGATFNPDGTIANYQAWQESWIERYNNESIDEDEFSAWQNAVKKYEDSLQHLNDAEKKYIDTINKIYDEHLEKVVYRVKYLNELIELSTDYLDYLIKKLDEDMYETADVVADMGKKASNILEQIDNVQKGIFDALTDKNNHKKLNDHKEIIEEYLKGADNLQEVLDNIQQLTDKEQEQLRDWMKQLIDYNEDLIETQKEAYEKIIESVEEFNDKIERQGNIVEDVTGIMQHYANVIDIIGKDTLGITDAMMNALSDLQVTGAQANLTIATNQLNQNKQILEEIQKNLDEARERGTESDIKHFEEALEKQEDIVRNLAEEWASAYEDALKSAQDAFTNGVKLATEAFDKAVSGSIGSLDKLQDFYDKQTTLKDIFLPDYERIHDLSKLIRDVNIAINNTDNIKGKERLRNLQEDILRAQQQETQLSKYDVEFMQKRLELEQALIAMEEARNAKNMVRMTRDNEGNWSYTYTQNPEEMEKAQQAYEDKLYELEKLNQERVKETQKLMLDAMIKFRDEMANADMNDKQKTEKLLEYWGELQEKYSDLTNTALEDGEWITDTYDVQNHKLIDSFEETLLSLETGYKTLEDFMNDFEEATTIMSDETMAQYDKWGNYVHTITDAAGIDFDNFAQRVQDDMDLVIAAMIGEDGEGGAIGAVKKLADEMGLSVHDILEELKTWWDGPEGRSFIMETEIAENEKTYEQLEKLIASADKIPVELPKISQAVQKIASGGNECGCGSTCTDTCWTDCGSNGASSPRCSCGSGCRGECGGACSTNCGSGCDTNHCTSTCGRGCGFGCSATGCTNQVSSAVSGATGMYTGAWGSEGKLAILHEKELVLNKEDTANMLQAVGFVRDLVEMLTTNAGISASGLGNLIAGGVSSASNYLDQNVTIHAEFPNATNHSEIEEAFENLIGLAGQYAGRK